MDEFEKDFGESGEDEAAGEGKLRSHGLDDEEEEEEKEEGATDSSEDQSGY
ncbi:MAG: hypothetical protein HYT43_01585 [Candidatus Taylorbacteria bacterium]|nr:hypothetical protein [Candidatus Taylorbacteria bacterium]